MAYGMPVQTRAGAGGRAYSFEETMLPPSALDQLAAEHQQQTNLTYSPYGGSQASPVPNMSGTLFAQPSWYGASLDMYGSPGSPLQPRPSPHMGMYGGGMAGGAGAMRGGPSMVSSGSMSPYGPYYPASSPGPPIQTTTSNKGPEGANLFIFHIPNHFTNLDMYQLFCPYGTLLSVRIMVEKDTGRSRGFGFVSYDNPESAAMAIKELNGFAVRQRTGSIVSQRVLFSHHCFIFVGPYATSPE
jgi:RNA recognition motif. (a.k.a. RRM, RBD, or RNP domain)